MPESDGFTHLHVHSDYSQLDGAAKLNDMIKAVKDDGQTALGLTDHGVMNGALEFYQACKAADINPCIGTELYQAKEDVTERLKRGKKSADGEDAEGGEKLYYHLTALAETNAGYKNLIKLSSRAFLEGYYYKPRVDWSMLEDHSEGVIVTTGCLGGQVLQHLLRDDTAGAIAVAARLQDIFGKDNTFVEIQDHGIPAQHQTFKALLGVAEAIGAPLVAVNDSHYVHRGDAVAHDHLLCIQTGSYMSDEKRFHFEGDEHYLKSAVEMRELFKELPQSCDNTLAIAERCNVEIPFGEQHLPVFTTPKEFKSDRDYLVYLVKEGAERRWGNLSEAQRARLNYEIKTISQLGYASYFLIVWDLVKWAKEQGIRTGPGRGSAAASAIAYCLGITQIDPLVYELPFERFLNIDRVSMPDIDLDVSPRGREALIQYTYDTYGLDYVAQIVTFARIKSRSAVRDTARVLEKPYAFGDMIVKAMPPVIMGRDVSLADCFDPDAERYGDASKLRDMYAADPDVAKVIDVAKGLEGLVRQDGVHAGAVVISDLPLTDIIPVQQRSKEGVLGPIVTQYEMHAVEDLGLLKMDFLGLRNLDVITDTLAFLAARGIEVDIDNIPLDDERTFDLLKKAFTIGVFQLEGAQMRNLIKRLAPTSFYDIAALVALYRPGPMAANMHNDYADRKNFRQPVKTFHPEANEILGETYGLMIYQELVAEVAVKFAGYTRPESFTLVKLCAKKLPEAMKKERGKFEAGCENLGYGKEFGSQLFGVIEKFADYAFNKAHSFSYGFIAFQTAYLKAHYAPEYMAALCSSVADKIERASIFLSEARAMGLDVQVPSVSQSGIGFLPIDNGIRVGMSAIRSVGEVLSHQIVEERQAGPFKDLPDFCRRMIPRGLNKVTFIQLAKAGALDEFGQSRRGMISVADEILNMTRKVIKKEGNGQISMLEDSGLRFEISDVEFTSDEKMRQEKDATGIYITGHPLDDLKDWTDRADCSVLELLEEDEGTVRWVVGIVSDIEVKVTKRGDTMAILTFEDVSSSAQVVVFPKSYAVSNLRLGSVARILVRAGLDYQDNAQFVLMKEEVRPVQEVEEIVVKVYLPEKFIRNDEYLARLKSIILSHRGTTPVALYLSKSKYMRLDDTFLVKMSDTFIKDVKALMKEYANEA